MLVEKGNVLRIPKMHLSRNILSDLQLLGRRNHLLSDLEIWHSGSLGMYLVNNCSDLFKFTQFLNYEIKYFKFTLFEMVNLIVQETNRIR